MTGYHLAFVNDGGVFDGSTNGGADTLKIYIDGVEKASGAIEGKQGGIDGDNDNPFAIGYHHSTFFDAYLQDVRVSQVARYTSNFAVPA